MSDLSVANSELSRQRQLADAAAAAAASPAAAKAAALPPTPSRARDTVESARPPLGAVAPARAARPAAALMAAMERSARSVMPPPSNPDHSVKHGVETVVAHAVTEGAARIAGHAFHLVAGVASAATTYLEAGMQVVENHNNGIINGQRKSAAAGFAHALAAALNLGTSSAAEAKAERHVAIARAAVPVDQHQQDFFNWGTSNALRFASTLSKAERASLVRELGQLPRHVNDGPPGDTTFDLATRIQRTVLRAEYDR